MSKERYLIRVHRRYYEFAGPIGYKNCKEEDRNPIITDIVEPNVVWIVEDGESVRHYSHGVVGVFTTMKQAIDYMTEHDGKWDGCEGSMTLRTSRWVLK